MKKSKKGAIPVIIIGGFLGAGKTTLLNYILSEQHGLNVGVLVNDFGAINIDAKLVVGVDGDTVSLANGCVCCSINDDLISACMELIQRSNPPELLIVETSGVSEPMPVANTFSSPEIEKFMALDSILTVVDAEQFPEIMKGEMASLARLQVRDADMLILNKVDLVDSKTLQTTKSLVRNIAPGTRMLESTLGIVSLNLITGMGLHTISKKTEPSKHSHQHEHPFSTWQWTSDKPLSYPRLRLLIENLPETIYRLKGIAYVEEMPSHQVEVQVVGKRSNIGDTELWGEKSPQSEIVMIGSRNGIDQDAMQRAFDDCIGNGDESQSPILRLNRFLAMDPESCLDAIQADRKTNAQSQRQT
jgi:G3E family GTPase